MDAANVVVLLETVSGLLASQCTLKPGDVGDEVGVLQTALTVVNFTTKGIDRNFGPMTTQALKAFQMAHALEAKGYVDSKTWMVMCDALKHVIVNSQKVTPAPLPPATPKVEVPHALWIWIKDDLPADHIETLKKLGCRRVILKAFDDSGSTLWPQASAASVAEYTSQGIEVWGWGYHFDQKKSVNISESVVAVHQAIKNGCTGYVFDVEVEIEDPATHNQLIELIKACKWGSEKGFTVGYSSFDYPDLHPQIPWMALQSACDVQLPQCYFEVHRTHITTFDETRAIVRQAFDSMRAAGLTQKPIYPVWSAEEGVQTASCTQSELQYFLDSYPGSSVWRFPKDAGAVAALEVTYGPAPQAEAPHAGNVNKNIYEFYCSQAGYAKVSQEVLNWFAPINDGSATHNGCAAFLSTALRMSGYKAVENTTLAQALAERLIALGWSRVTMKNLQMGDIIVTEDAPEWPGYAAHIFMFAGWENQAQAICTAVDNQSVEPYPRNLGLGPKTPMNYALRCPD